MKISVDELLQIIGSKEVEILLLKQQIAEMKAQLEEKAKEP